MFLHIAEVEGSAGFSKSFIPYSSVNFSTLDMLRIYALMILIKEIFVH
jgi:hypothetical protein